MIEIKYVGCDDPGKVLHDAQVEQEEEDRLASLRRARLNMPEHNDASVRVWPEPAHWSSLYPSFEAFRDATLAREAAVKESREVATALAGVAFPDLLETLPDVRLGHPVGHTAAMAVRDEVRDRFGTVLADDYVDYMARYGCMSICDFRHTGTDEAGDYGIIAAIGDSRQMLDIPEKYYPLTSIDVPWCYAKMFFQDGDGFVYLLDAELKFMPVCRGLKSYSVEFWQMCKERIV